MTLKMQLTDPDAGQVHSSLCLMLLPEYGDISAFTDLSVIPLEEMHVTLMYCGDSKQFSDKGVTRADLIEVVKNTCAKMMQKNYSMMGIAKSITTFPAGDDGVPVIVRITSPDATALRRAMKTSLMKIGVEDTGTYKTYKPHMTLGYAKEDAQLDLPTLRPVTIHYRGIRIGYEGSYTDIEFKSIPMVVERKDVYNGQDGIRPKRGPRRPIYQRAKRGRIKKRAMHMCNPKTGHVARRTMMTMKSLDQKDIRHVRTQGGVDHFGQPIGSIIVGDGQILKHVSMDTENPKPYPGWDRVVSSSGQKYDIGNDPADDRYSAVAVGEDGHSDWADVAVSGGRDEEQVLVALDGMIEKGNDYKPGSGAKPITVRSAAQNRTPRVPRKKKTDTNPRRGRDFRPMTEEEKKKWGIPPAWSDVMWNNSRDENASDDKYDGLIAQGKDAAGRTQSAYTLRHRAVSGQSRQMQSQLLQKHFSKVNKRIRDDAKAGIPEAQALLVSMIMGSRIGSEKDTGGKTKAYGVSTLEARHVLLYANGKTRLDFIGKKGERNRPQTDDKEIRAMFEKLLEGKSSGDQVFPTNEIKMNDYFRGVQSDLKIKNTPITAHVFRHRMANAAALKELNRIEKAGKFTYIMRRTDKTTGKIVETKRAIKFPPHTKAEYAKLRMTVGTYVAEILQNKPNQALTSYISPDIFDQYISDEGWRAKDDRNWKPGQPLTSTGVTK